MNVAQPTICAVSTPAGAAGRGIVRISGAHALALAEKIFDAEREPLRNLRTYTAIDGCVRLEAFVSPAPAALYLMRAPYSYTREDVVEIHLPSSAPLLRAVLDELVTRGAELAAPGEFTRRAYLNGRIDLTQAEAVAAAIQSNTAAELRIAVTQLQGRFGERVRTVREQVLHILAEIEADLDFSDQDLDLISDDALVAQLDDAARRVAEMLSRKRAAPIRRDAVDVAICGRPNVGKSSLLNRLVGRERAIVSDTAGATRDLIDDLVEIDGIHFRLIDTPGMGHSRGGLDAQAQVRGRELASRAPVVVLVLDRSEGLLDEDVAICQAIHGAAIVTALNKSDLPPAVSPQLVESRLGAPAAAVSCRSGEGVDDVRRLLAETITSAQVDLSASLAIANARHQQALAACRDNLSAARTAVRDRIGREFAAIDLRDAAAELGSMLGDALDAPEAVLDRVFSQFCIGK